MKHLFWGLLLAFIVITPITAQKQTTILSSSTALDLMSKARKNDLHYNEYLNIGYYLLRENKPDHANRYFSMAAKKYLYFNKQYKYLGRNKLAKKLEKLQNETDSLINLNYLTTTNPKVLKEIELYKSVTKKSYSKLIQLIEDEQQKNKILSRYLVRWGKKSKILKTFIPEYHELMKPKTEFETKTQYKARKNKYEIHEKEATKEIDQRIEKIEIPFDKALTACASQKSKVKKRK